MKIATWVIFEISDEQKIDSLTLVTYHLLFDNKLLISTLGKMLQMSVT